MKKKLSKIIRIAVVVIIALLSVYIIMENRVIKEGTIDGYHYTVGETSESCKHNTKEEFQSVSCKFDGYIIDEYDDKIDYTIYIGEHSGGGWNIFVRKIKKEKDGSIVIIIDEKKPSAFSLEAPWSTTPNITITFDKRPNNLIIKDTKGKEYKLINND